ncbi:hypothetical protein AC578_1288 [Pseudocercospora eumusae]|uniref:Uncharacterized protein n=1 Tax=Pseudocercospora eumusae TaxID=321146 RepID=A0A139HUB5_9PEZI|nr:hypothetical protein AC578_1288 [Pseudocercospora eumusae]
MQDIADLAKKAAGISDGAQLYTRRSQHISKQRKRKIERTSTNAECKETDKDRRERAEDVAGAIPSAVTTHDRKTRAKWEGEEGRSMAMQWEKGRTRSGNIV